MFGEDEKPKEAKHALYLIDPESSHVELIHADDVADKKANGWKEPTNAKPNGEQYNQEDDLEGQDAAADGARRVAEYKAKKAASK